MMSITTLALNWFGDHEKATAIAIGSVAYPFGALVGFAFPSFFINDDTPNHKEEGLKAFGNFIFALNIVSTIVTVPILILTKDRPPSPPAYIPEPPELKIVEDYKFMTTNWNFQTLFWTMNLLYGVYSALGSIISFLASPYYNLD